MLVFRGTIDFKTGSSNSVGNEKETVLMLGDDVINKTVPLILCAEENVVGNHGATIGELDDETLFYLKAAASPRAQAENILARASIERFARTVDDSAARRRFFRRWRRNSTMTYDYKRDFPIFQHTDVAYIDNAATAQRPQCVLDAVADFTTAATMPTPARAVSAERRGDRYL